MLRWEKKGDSAGRARARNLFRPYIMATLGAALSSLLSDATSLDDIYLAMTFCGGNSSGGGGGGSGEVGESGVALNALGQFLRVDGHHGVVSPAACRQLVELLLDAAADKSRGSRRHRRVGLLLRWLLTDTEFAQPISEAVGKCLSGGGSAPPNRVRLAAATAMRVETF